MNAESLGAIAGVVLSLIFSYVPGVNAWFASLAKEQKQMTMGFLLIVVAIGSFSLACAGLYTDMFCTRDGAIKAAQVLIAALVANQSMYLITKK